MGLGTPGSLTVVCWDWALQGVSRWSVGLGTPGGSLSGRGVIADFKIYQPHTEGGEQTNKQATKQTSKQTNTHTQKQTHEQTRNKTNARKHTHTQTHTQTHTDTHTHTNTHTHVPTHTHTHITHQPQNPCALCTPSQRTSVRFNLRLQSRSRRHSLTDKLSCSG